MGFFHAFLNEVSKIAKGSSEDKNVLAPIASPLAAGVSGAAIGAGSYGVGKVLDLRSASLRKLKSSNRAQKSFIRKVTGSKYAIIPIAALSGAAIPAAWAVIRKKYWKKRQGKKRLKVKRSGIENILSL